MRLERERDTKRGDTALCRAAVHYGFLAHTNVTRKPDNVDALGT